MAKYSRSINFIPNLENQQINNYNHNTRQNSHPISEPGGHAKNQPSLFDYYNRNLLLLSQCQEQDVFVIQANPVVREEVIIVSAPIIPQTVIKKQPYRKVQQTSNQPLHHKLTESQQNQILFNYQKIAKDRMQQKKKFLEKIQMELEKLQKQAENAQEFQHQSRQKMNNINELQSSINHSIQNNRINKLSINNFLQDQHQRQPINIYMQAGQINQLLENQFNANNDLLDKIDVIVKGKNNTNNIQNKHHRKDMNKTVKFQQRNKGSRSKDQRSIDKITTKTNFNTKPQKKLIKTTQNFGKPPKI